ncbi:MAG: transposase [Caldilineaceae bacterium]
MNRFSLVKNIRAYLPRLVLADHYQTHYVRRCEVTQQLLQLLRQLDCEQLPASLTWHSSGERTLPLAAYIGAYLIKLERNLSTFGALRRFLREHPGLIWALGFPPVAARNHVTGFDADASIHSYTHFPRKLTLLPNAVLQALLDAQVAALHAHYGAEFGQVISIDTKHILAWVKENNPKASPDKDENDQLIHSNKRQPAGDKDCKPGCKRRRNQVTPTKEGKPLTEKGTIREYYWGYASGVVATNVLDFGEFVLAECTQTFDLTDISYFFPLIEPVEAHLGFRPSFAAADAAFDGFYIYDYFHQPDGQGFAAIPLRQMKHGIRRFDADGFPLCDAKLVMKLKSSFTNRTSMVQHKRVRYVCPLLYPEPNGQTCPIAHKSWSDGGCRLTFPLSPGTRIRYQLERESDAYKDVFHQRTAVERIFSQVVNLGIERPKLRNQAAITNMNTLTYLLINLHLMHRLAL